MEITRQLRKDKLTKKGYAPIQVAICWAQQRVRLFTGERTKPAWWDEDKEQVTSAKGSYYTQINERLADISLALGRAEQAADDARRLLTEADVHAAVASVLHPEAAQVPPAPAPSPADAFTGLSVPALFKNWIDRRAGRQAQQAQLLEQYRKHEILQVV